MRRVGKMTLNRNPDNFFAETEQVAFCVQSEIAEHYGVDAQVHEPHATTLDYVVAAAAG